jgi:hypothetical protein
LPHQGIGRSAVDQRNHRSCRLLRCDRPRRPRRRSAANDSDELAPSHCPRGSGQGIVAAKTSTVLRGLMSALGQKATSRSGISISALPAIAGIAAHGLNVRSVPIVDVLADYLFSRRQAPSQSAPGGCCCNCSMRPSSVADGPSVGTASSTAWNAARASSQRRAR